MCPNDECTMCPRGNLGVKNKNTKTPVRMGSKGATTAAPPTFIFLRKRLIEGGHSGEHLTEHRSEDTVQKSGKY